MPLIVFLLALLFFSQAWADACDQLPKPSVTVKRIEARITLNTKYNYKEITHLGAELARPGNWVLGLTRGSGVAQFGTQTPAYIDPTGQWECTSPQLTVSIGFSPMTVYVAKEFPEGGCAYQEIYQHEQRHVKAYQAHIGKIEKDITDTLNSRFATGAPWRGPSGQTRARLQDEINERWLPYLQRELKRVETEQALIDTPEEYERVANSCNGEIKKLRGDPSPALKR